MHKILNFKQLCKRYKVMRTIKIILPALAILLFASCGKEEIETSFEQENEEFYFPSVTIIDDVFDKGFIFSNRNAAFTSSENYTIHFNKELSDGRGLIITLKSKDFTDPSDLSIQVFNWTSPLKNCDGGDGLLFASFNSFDGEVSNDGEHFNVVGTFDLRCSNLETGSNTNVSDKVEIDFKNIEIDN